MYKIEFYEDEKGHSDFIDFIKGLHKRAATNKESRKRRQSFSLSLY